MTKEILSKLKEIKSPQDVCDQITSLLEDAAKTKDKALLKKVYDHGKKEGFSLVKYPNGRIHYRGEYQNDKMIGLWSTYDEKGNLITEKEYGVRK